MYIDQYYKNKTKIIHKNQWVGAYFSLLPFELALVISVKS